MVISRGAASCDQVAIYGQTQPHGVPENSWSGTLNTDFKIFEIENFRLQAGLTLPCAKLAYKTYGTLAEDRSNAILYPTSYGAQHGDTEWLIGKGRVLDPSDWFIVII